MSQEENDSVVWRKDNGKIGKSGFCSRSYEPDVHSSQFSFLLDLVNKYWFHSYNLCLELGFEALAVNKIIMIPALLKFNLNKSINNE